MARIAGAIRRAGLSNQKAPRIKTILRRIHDERGELSLDFLRTERTPQALDYLTDMPGVGPKTAACVLLFSLGKPAFPVDTHIYRIAKRLGLVDSRASAEKTHGIMGAMIPAGHVYQLHIHLIEHGRRICKAQHPRCHGCVLLPGCPTGWQLLGITMEQEVKV